jgi:hypothetical protein
MTTLEMEEIRDQVLQSEDYDELLELRGQIQKAVEDDPESADYLRHVGSTLAMKINVYRPR